MNSRTCVLISILITHGLLCSAAEKISLAGLRTNFVTQAVLSEKDLTAVIKLAENCGVKQVAEVYTFNADSSHCAIGVKGAEVTNGREVTSVSAVVCSKKWGSKRPKHAREVLNSNGGFWIERGDVCTNVLTTFKTSTGLARVQLAESVSMSVADRIMDAFANNRVKYAAGAPRKMDDLNGIYFPRPASLEARENTFAACYFPSQWVVVCVYFSFEGDQITVVRVDKLAS